jgi:hypothetical protein
MILRRGTRAIGAAVAAAAFTVAFAATPPRGERSLRRFDPDRLADLELRIWQAYSATERVRLFGLLATAQREQYRYSWLVAAREGFHLARARLRFRDLHDGYEAVLSDLEAASTTARSHLHARFDARAVAQAELAWWIASRAPGQNNPEQVGALIADQYALLYETSRERVARAALLRAEAATLRDGQAQRPDWDTIAQLLRASYRELLAALSSANV